MFEEVPGTWLTQVSSTLNKKADFICRCGAVKNIIANDVKTGHTKSCGCFRKVANAKLHTKSLSTIMNIDGDKCLVELHGRASKTHPFATISKIDVELVSGYRWVAFVPPNKRTIYARSTTNVFMHRVIMNPRDEEEVDHKDHDGLNNTRDNLRVCTSAQNKQNMSSRPNSSSRYLGVSWDKRSCRWYAKIGHEGKSRFIGIFDKEIDAALARDKAAFELFGDFANLNFPRI